MKIILNGISSKIDAKQLKLIITVSRNDVVSKIEISTIKNEIINSEYDFPAVNLINPSIKVFNKIKSKREIRGKSSTNEIGINMYFVISQDNMDVERIDITAFKYPRTGISLEIPVSTTLLIPIP